LHFQIFFHIGLSPKGAKLLVRVPPMLCCCWSWNPNISRYSLP
jgi:hypothetical protein